ncbi:tripartite tricarboxylate transporter TctB family protein [Polaromonas sp. C04]|uniref:tripartite tricarboxylate transporter TctB family protein n=1 Tax=Polaromonas sp. C04 TaxID=1945857 RepID=UPI0009CC4BD1|nr:tripartite tricarboxylate transporter TctB family protein [Polaromonas sp. C04]OOG51187.1 hypothetical protein B0E49_16315 [Polaromonas sp. C04]
MSTNQEETKNTHSQSASGWMADAVVAVVIFLIGVAIMVDSHRIGAGWLDGNLQAGYFPFRIGAILCLASAVIFFSAFFGGNRNVKPFVEPKQLKSVLTIFIPSLLYIFGIEFVGIYVASMIFIAGFMRISKHTSWWRAIPVSVGFSLALFILFEIVFLVPLPKGPIESLFGY